MSLAEELLKDYTLNGGMTGTGDRIIIGDDRIITIPESMRKIAVQHDHNIETITFVAPRYWDGRDMSKMKIYVNYMRSDDVVGSDLAENVIVDDEDDTKMIFDWTITGHLTEVFGPVTFLVCAKKVGTDGEEKNHWNSELCKDAYISEGLECEEVIIGHYPGLLTTLLNRMDIVDSKTTDEAIEGYVKNYIINNDNSIKAFIFDYLNTNSEKIDKILDSYLSDYAYYERVNDGINRTTLLVGSDIIPDMLIKLSTKKTDGELYSYFKTVSDDGQPEGFVACMIKSMPSLGDGAKPDEKRYEITVESNHSYMFPADVDVYLPIRRTDPSLSKNGLAADAKIVGDRLTKLEKVSFEFDEETASLYITLAE